MPTTRTRNKTLAIWAALFGGPLGLHRLYLYGWSDLLAWILPTICAPGLYGIWRIRTFGIDDRLSWALVPLIGFAFSGCALAAIVYGLTDARKWNQTFNPNHEPDHPAGKTHWLTVATVVLAMLLGTTALIASIVWCMQHIFELQLTGVPGISAG